MGTNYYYYTNKPCPHCGRNDEPMHIGKSSAGWCFSLHVEPGIVSDLDDWIELFKKDGSFIKDEYGNIIAVDEMLKEIKNRECTGMFTLYKHGEWVYPYMMEKEFHKKNHSTSGPGGLLRHRIDKIHCIGHGEGTWDLCVGEFS